MQLLLYKQAWTESRASEDPAIMGDERPATPGTSSLRRRSPLARPAPVGSTTARNRETISTPRPATVVQRGHGGPGNDIAPARVQRPSDGTTARNRETTSRPATVVQRGHGGPGDDIALRASSARSPAQSLQRPRLTPIEAPTNRSSTRRFVPASAAPPARESPPCPQPAPNCPVPPRRRAQYLRGPVSAQADKLGGSSETA